VDVCDAGALAGLASGEVQKYAKIDILVANAGIAGPNHKSWEYPIDAWKQVIEVNLNGVFFSCVSGSSNLCRCPCTRPFKIGIRAL